MAENKKSFILYSDIIHTVKKLSREQAGDLFLHILSYVNDEDPVTDDLLIQVVFEPIRQSLKRDLTKWSDTKEIRTEIGRKGGLKSGEVRRLKMEANEAIALKNEANEANEAIALKSKQNEANEAVSVSVSDSVNVKKENLLKKIDTTKIGLEGEIEIKNKTDTIAAIAAAPTLEERKLDFGKKLQAFEKDYSRKMLASFYNYWTEHNEGGKKMRFEMERVFSLSGRLSTWNSKDKEYGKQNNSAVGPTATFKTGRPFGKL